MHIMHACGSFLFSLIVPALLWMQAPIAASATPATISEPPRQQMQTVAPNVPIGPYFMFITGKTFVDDVFFDIALSAGGHPVPDGTTVTLDAAPPLDKQTARADGTPQSTGGTPVHLTATTLAGHAKFAPALDTEGDWRLTVLVEGPAGKGTTMPLQVGVDPHSPPASLFYRLSQLAIPIVSLFVLLIFFRLRHITLERRPTDRTQTSSAY